MTKIIEQLTNPYTLFMLYVAQSQIEPAMAIAKRAFLWVIDCRSAWKFQKSEMLEDIAKKFPEILPTISGEEFVAGLKQLEINLHERAEPLSYQEMVWIRLYVKDPVALHEMEKRVYRSMLLSNVPLADQEKLYWALSLEEKSALASGTLKHVGYESALKLVDHFNLPVEAIEPILKKALHNNLWKRNYEEATGIVLALKEKGVSAEVIDSVVRGVIVLSIENGYLKDAVDIARQFVPDLAEEASMILETINRYRYYKD